MVTTDEDVSQCQFPDTRGNAAALRRVEAPVQYSYVYDQQKGCRCSCVKLTSIFIHMPWGERFSSIVTF